MYNTIDCPLFVFVVHSRPLVGSEQEPALLLELFEQGTQLLLGALPSVFDGSCTSVLRPQDDTKATKVCYIYSSFTSSVYIYIHERSTQVYFEQRHQILPFI